MIRLLIQVAFEKSIYNAAPSAKTLDFKKEQKPKLMSLDFYNSLPFLFLDRGFSVVEMKEEREEESKGAFTGDSQCATPHTGH